MVGQRYPSPLSSLLCSEVVVLRLPAATLSLFIFFWMTRRGSQVFEYEVRANGRKEFADNHAAIVSQVIC